MRPLLCMLALLGATLCLHCATSGAGRDGGGTESSEDRASREASAKVAYARLGRAPSEQAIDSFLTLYGDLPIADRVRREMRARLLDGFVVRRDLLALRDFETDCEDTVLCERASGAIRFLETARDPRDAAPFSAYLEQFPRGDFAEVARRMVDWNGQLPALRRAAPRVQILGASEGWLSELLVDKFRSRDVAPEFVAKLLPNAARPGEIVYRLSVVRAGETGRRSTVSGEEVTFEAPASALVVELLRTVAGSGKARFQVVWSEVMGGGIAQWANFPTVAAPVHNAILRTEAHEGRVGGVTRVGDYLAVTDSQIISFYDSHLRFAPQPVDTFPDRQEEILEFRTRAFNSLPAMVAHGSVAALFGHGLQLLDCRLASHIRRISDERSLGIGHVRAATFVRGYLYFSDANGLYVVHPKWGSPKKLDDVPATHLGRLRDRLLVATLEGVFLRRVKRGGTLGPPYSVTDADQGRRWSGNAPVVSSWSDGKQLLLADRAGRLASLDLGRLKGYRVSEQVAGPVRRLFGDDKRVMALSNWGVTLLRHDGKRWRGVATLPMAECVGGLLDWPYAHVTCGRRLITVHVAALEAGVTAPR